MLRTETGEGMQENDVVGQVRKESHSQEGTFARQPQVLNTQILQDQHHNGILSAVTMSSR